MLLCRLHSLSPLTPLPAVAVAGGLSIGPAEKVLESYHVFDRSSSILSTGHSNS